MEIENCKQIFEALPSRFNAGAAGPWKATIQFKIAGDKGGNFVVNVGDGKCETNEGEHASPTATIETNDQTWMGITMGKVNPMTAFTLGQLKVKGNVGDVMKMQSVIKMA